MQGDPPVKPVAAQIRQLAAAVPVIPERIQGLGRVVFGVATSRHGRITGQQVNPFVMQFPIGHDIERDILGIQPGEQVRVGRKVP